MGTRNSTLVKLNGEYKIAQYGQWDGYPTGAGQTIADFLKTVDLEDFINKVSKLEAFTEDEVNDIVNGNQEMFIGANRDWTLEYPQLSRDMGADILKAVASGAVKKVSLDTEFKNDDLFCEYWYELDLDNETIVMNGNDPYTFEEWTQEGFMEELENK